MCLGCRTSGRSNYPINQTILCLINHLEKRLVFVRQTQYQNAGASCQPARPSLVDRVLAAVAPWRCVLCGDAAAGMDLCIDCLNDLPWLARSCLHCGMALPESELRICGACLRSAPPVDHALAALCYEYPVPNMIAALKYRRQVCYARVLGELLTIRLQEELSNDEFSLPDVLVPVPLHPRRQMRRTFNQAELIAGHVARTLGLHIDHRVLRRVVNTPPQMGLRRSERLKNLRGVFRAMGDLSGMNIALVDDVITTCSTVRETARVLKRAGAPEVQVWAVARAV